MESADFLLPVIVLMQIGSPWVTQKTFSNILISFLYSLPLSTLKSRDAFLTLGWFSLHRTLQTFSYKISLVLQLLGWIFTILLYALPSAFNLYKTRERIHRGLLIRDYYQFRLHEGGFQPSIWTEAKFEGLACRCRLATHCFSPL